MADQLVSSPILPGVADAVPTVPVPSSPASSLPHVQRLPSFFIATVWLYPPATCAQSLVLPTRSGDDMSVVVPSPSWPDELDPHAHKLPSFRTARALLD